MRKITAWFFILLGTALLVISTSRPLMNSITARRSALPGWAGTHHPEGAGDLMSMAYLDRIAKFRDEKEYHFIKLRDTGTRNIDLYIYGDSYVKDVPDSAFGHVAHYHFARRDYEDLIYTLDPHRKNILIIEDAERFIRIYFQYLAIFDHVKKAYPDRGFYPDKTSFPGKTRFSDEAMPGIKADQFFNPDINRNLEFNLFGYHFLDRIRLFKATATYNFFGRAAGDVVISGDGQRLFLRQTVAAHDPLSCYEPLDKKEMAIIIDHLNTIYDHYKKEGFDEVYLSLLPNPATILQPRYYNGLIPELQRAHVLKAMPVLDLYSIFSLTPDPGKLYLIGDSHWTNNGLQLWLNVVNDELNKQSQQH